MKPLWIKASNDVQGFLSVADRHNAREQFRLFRSCWITAEIRSSKAAAHKIVFSGLHDGDLMRLTSLRQ
jgi:hypothetical protein